jgi:uncharacterized protein YqjF (DUF2071 family)
MTIQHILDTINHRPWELPQGNWEFYQEWNKAIFLHYEVNIADLEHLVPKELEIDLFDGNPWVSVVAFTMENIRPKNLPALALVSNFDEVNIRTYVKFNNKSGVYFLSIEASKRLSAIIAKRVSQLPYRFSHINRAQFEFHSQNRSLNDHLDIEFKIGNKVTSKSVKDKWLTERYALFQDSPNGINQFEIHHIEWPIYQVEQLDLNLHYARFSNLIQSNADIIHYSPGVKVLSWGKESHKRTCL